MNKQLLNNLTMNETDVIASRRKFLTRMAYGSLLAISGSGIAEAAVKHAVHGSSHSKKAEPKHAANHSSSHDSKKVKDTSSHKHADLKTASAHHKPSKHAEHIKVSNNTHEHHRLHNDVNNRIALRHNKHPIIHRHVDIDMPEFDVQREEEEVLSRFHSDDIRHLDANDMRNRFDFRDRLSMRSNNGNITHRSLELRNNTTGDSANVTYFEQGRYLPDALDEINYLYRDHLTDEIHPVDTALLDQLHDLQNTLGVGKRPINVICGYRSPFTNAHLRRNSRGVARKSLHMEGRAIDIRIAGVDSRNIRDAALSMARGGVGYYPGSNFVHLDTGDFRTW